MKIRYIETKPITQVLEFEDREKYNEFFSKRIQEIIDYTYPNNINYYDYFKYKRILLNKDGTPRKSIDPKWLHTKKAHKNQKKNWKLYCKKRKEKTFEKSYRRKMSDIEYHIDYWQKQKIELEKEYKEGQDNTKENGTKSNS